MRRFDKLQSIIRNVPGRFAAAMAVLLLAVCPMTAQGQAQPQKKAPARSAQSHAAPGSPATARKRSAEKPKSEPDMAWIEDALKDPELMKATGQLSQRLVNELQFPAARTQSRILPRLSAPVAFYFAVPNYGQTLHQAQEIFQQELRGSPALQNFLHKNKLDADEPKMEEELQKVYEITQYLGDEVVITGTMNGEKPNFVVAAEVKKPGLKAFLEQTYQQFQKTGEKPLRIFDPQQLAAFNGADQEGGLLIRPDFIIGSDSIATLRKFSSQLDTGGGAQPFTATPLGKKLAQSYQNGTFTVLAMNLQPFLDLIPQSPPQTRLMLEKTGFGDMNYLLAASTMEGKDSVNEMELAFQGPRHGVASWIAAPAPLGSLDFLSPKSLVAEAIRLKSPAQIFDDIVELAGPNALAMLPQMEAQMNVSLKQDILNKLGGEIAFEMQNPPDMEADASPGHATAAPNFKVVLSVSDPAGLQQTLKRLLATAPMESGERVENGVTFYTLSPPSANGASTEFNYFFLDGYLVVTSNHALAQEAVRLHRGGESLARSSDIVAHGRPVKASALAYQNTGSFLASMLKQMPTGTAGLQLWQALGAVESKPTLFLGYADETSMRGVSSNSVATNASMGLIVAAIAIPNLLRSRMAANEAAAASTLRTVNTAQITYVTSYPAKGYAPSLATLGPGANGDCSESNVSAAHACLLNNVVGNASCTAGKWCEKNGYRFSVRGVCTPARCSSYTVTATPLNEGTGGKSFCSTTDAVIRQQAGAPLTAPLTAAECKAWKPIM
jgi:type IV pilus assembly protein PilA